VPTPADTGRADLARLRAHALFGPSAQLDATIPLVFGVP
jgi:hypothetical protein